VVGSHKVNGVAELHSELVRKELLSDFCEIWPDRFTNKTNGVTPRRWMLFANPPLADVITGRLGRGWIVNLDQLERLRELTDDAGFHEELQTVKEGNKVALANYIQRTNGVHVDPTSIFDVHVKRIHEYKRQLLNCLHIVALYQSIKRNPDVDVVPRTFIFGGKAAPGYATAKLHIKLINDVASIVNDDPAMRDRLKVVFLANYNVSLAELIIPGADVSEQISMAGKEASGTGNMKFAMNGALTIGTLDGANIEIRDAVGAANFFLFGLTAEEVKGLDRQGYYPGEYLERSERLRDAIDLIGSGFFSPGEPDRFASVVEHLHRLDTYKSCADFEDYVRAQREVSTLYRDKTAWTTAVANNLAMVGRFSSDRTIKEYASEIWGVEPVTVLLDHQAAPKFTQSGSYPVVDM
jgi:starch phosphorylase